MTPEQKRSLTEALRQPTPKEEAEFEAIAAGMRGTPSEAAIIRLEKYLERDDVPQLLLMSAGELVETTYDLED